MSLMTLLYELLVRREKSVPLARPPQSHLSTAFLGTVVSLGLLKS